MIFHVLINIGDFIPKVHPYLTNKNSRASAYQSSAKNEEGLTQVAESVGNLIFIDVNFRGSLEAFVSIGYN
jgi:hypothetical protein